MARTLSPENIRSGGSTELSVQKLRSFLNKCNLFSLAMAKRFPRDYFVRHDERHRLRRRRRQCRIRDQGPDAQAPKVRRVDSREAERLYRVMTPLLRVMDRRKFKTGANRRYRQSRNQCGQCRRWPILCHYGPARKARICVALWPMKLRMTILGTLRNCRFWGPG